MQMQMEFYFCFDCYLTLFVNVSHLDAQIYLVTINTKAKYCGSDLVAN